MRYLDFSKQDWKGHSFQGQELVEADFSESDIRGCDFSRANLEGANFQSAIAGLTHKQGLTLVVVAIVLAFIAGFVAALAAGVFFLAFQRSLGQTALIGVLLLAPILAFSTKRYGYIALASTLAVAIAIAGAGIGALIGANMGALTIALFLTVCGIGAATGAGIYATIGNRSVWIAVLGSLLAAIALGIWTSNPLAGVLAIAAAGTVETLAGFVAHSAFKGNEKLDWVRQQALAFTTWGGTSFYRANLTNANFSYATITKSDFRNAAVTRTNFKESIGSEYCRFEGTLLYSPTIREICITGSGQGKNFDGLSLRGVNWSRAVLSDVSFIGTDLSEANLQGSDLSRAKLVQTQLDRTNLACARLTGACIENWGITVETRLDNVECQYVFMRLPTQENPEPYRKPDNRQEEFQLGDFADFIRPIVETLDLYHNGSVDPRAIAIAFKSLAENNPDADLHIAAMEVKGQDKFLLRAKTTQGADKSKLSEQYFDTYHQLRSLPDTNIRLLIAEKDDRIRSLETMIGTAINQPKFHIEHNLGGIMSDSINVNAGGSVGAVGGDDVNISGFMNLGVISGNVTNTINQLQESHEMKAPQLAGLLQQLQTSIEQSELSEKDKAKALKHLDAIAKQGCDRTNPDLRETTETALDALTGIFGKAGDLLKSYLPLLRQVQQIVFPI